MPRVILVASKIGYQVREFHSAAQKLDIDLTLATDRCHVLDDPWGDQAAAVDFEHLDMDATGLETRGPFDGIVAVGDKPAVTAAGIASRLSLRFHSPEAARAAGDKFLSRQKLRSAGMNVPRYRVVTPGGDAQGRRYPCVLKPLHLSGSRGVIRADNDRDFDAACARIREISRAPEILVEDYIPGREFALEGIVTDGRLQVLAIFDKPDPLEGPFFEETIYLTPSAETAATRQAMEAAAQDAVRALGLTYGPVHAEMRINERGVWVLEAAARPIGGLCSRVLRFDGDVTLEELLLRHALGRDVSHLKLAHGARGVMMIPIPRAGIYTGASGLKDAAQTADIEAIEITAKEGQHLLPLPEGSSYLGFLFAKAGSREDADGALRRAHSCLQFHISQALPILK